MSQRPLEADPEVDNHLQQQGLLRGAPAGPHPPMQRLQHAAPRASVLVLQQLDPKRMELSDEERQWALAIKGRVASCKEIDDLSDMLYAQLAIVTGGDVDEGVHRAANLQSLKEDLKIRDDYEEGKQVVAKYWDYFPGVIMSFYFHAPDGTYVTVFDAAKFKDWKAHEKKQAALRLTYYLCQTLNPDLEATRKGCSMFIEAQGYHPSMDISLFNQMFVDVMGSYPMRLGHIKSFHTPMLYNVLISMLKKIVPDEFASKFQVGCTFPGGRLDQFYTLPTPEAAARKTIGRLMECLRLKYENEKAFTL
jgi:CRAL/TRIO domain